MISSFATLFSTFSIAIIFLESHQKVHHDISYTNVLLQGPGKNLPEMKANQEQVMNNLGLAEIEIQCHKLKCQEGLLIDFDYGGKLAVAQSQEEMEQNQPKQEQAREQQDEEDKLEDGEGSTIGCCANNDNQNDNGNDSGVQTVGPF